LGHPVFGLNSKLVLTRYNEPIATGLVLLGHQTSLEAIGEHKPPLKCQQYFTTVITVVTSGE